MNNSVYNIATFNRKFDQLRKKGATDIALVIPVNAKADIHNMLLLLGDIARYNGPYSIEVILVINNFSPDEPPPYISDLEQQGLRVLAIPNVRRPGMAVALSGRMHGIEAADCEAVVSFDADCRIPDPTSLINWYVSAFQDGATAAYTYVGHYDVRPGLSIKARLVSHHLARWAKRVILKIPTTRGGNYAVRRSFILPLYEQGYIADEMNVGPTVKAHRGRVIYSNRRSLRVLTSGRYIKQNWGQLRRYLWYRLRYNLRTIPTKSDAAERTRRS